MKQNLINDKSIGVDMLETSQERVRLLREGIDGKTIEKLYLIYNDFRIIHVPPLFNVIEITSSRYSAEEYKPF